MKGLENILKFFEEYTDNFSTQGIITLTFDFLLIGLTIFFFLYMVNQKKKLMVNKIIIVIIVEVILFIVSIIFSLSMFRVIMSIIIFWTIGVFVISYTPEIRHYLENSNSSSKSATSFSSTEEKKEVIDIICNTAVYLSKRKVGALITIERKDSLDEYIQNAIDIECVISQEIMTTIFTPGTACHDGAIIVRKNKIMCAGAYFPSTLKYDLPKSLGSRHRAAIGISEHVDALTVVVSEQTGNISVTLDGTINQNLNYDKLKEILNVHLLEEEE